MRRVLIPQNLHALPEQLPKGEQQMITGRSMGTTWTVQYVDAHQHTKSVVGGLIQRELDLVVTQMSTWQADSNLCIFNQAAAGTWHVLPAPFYTVLDCAVKIAKETDGAFDPTIGPLVNLWGFGPEGQRTAPPMPDEINTLRARCGWHKLKLDSASRQALQAGDVSVDFSGIAKGYSVDRIASALRDAGIESYLIEVGGELYGAGIKPDGQPWWVALENSPGAENLTQSIVALHGLAVATSGDYRRYFTHNGRHYAHTINPRTGYPIDGASNKLVSVTVLHAECMVADALATAFTVMGVESSLAYARKHAIAVLLVEHHAAGFEEHFSPEFMAMME